MNRLYTKKEKGNLRWMTSAWLCFALLFICVLVRSLSAFAAESDGIQTKLDISKGNILISGDSITGKDENGVEITQTDPDGYYIIQTTDTTQNNIIVQSGEHSLTIERLNITGGNPIHILSGATVNLTLTGDNQMQGGENSAAVRLPDGATLVITAESTGALSAAGGQGGRYTGGGAGIGGNGGGYWSAGEHCGTLIVNGGNITAVGNTGNIGGHDAQYGAGSAGIGGGGGGAYGVGGNGGVVVINGGKISATGGSGVNTGKYGGSKSGSSIGYGGGGGGENYSGHSDGAAGTLIVTDKNYLGNFSDTELVQSYNVYYINDVTDLDLLSSVPEKIQYEYNGTNRYGDVLNVLRTNFWVELNGLVFYPTEAATEGWYKRARDNTGEETTKIRECGSYTAYFGPAEEDRIKADVEIVQGKTEASISLENWAWDEEANSPIVASGNDEQTEYSVFYKLKGADDSTYTAAIPTVIGDYTAKVVYGEIQNYAATEAMADFSITKAANMFTTPFSITGWKYGEMPNEPIAAVKYGEIVFTYSASENGPYTSALPASAGVWYCKATVDETENYFGLEKIISFEVTAISSENITVDFEKNSFTYNESEQKPVVTVKSGEGTLRENVDYEIEWPLDCISAGQKTVTIRFKGNYNGSISKIYLIENASQSAPVVNGVNESICAKADGKITGVDSAMEYRTADKMDYTPISDTEIVNLAAGTYYVRYAAKTNYNASVDAEVIIGVGKKLTVTVPAKQTGYTLTASTNELDWHGSATLTFKLVDGYSKTNDFAISAVGATLTDNSDGTYTISSAEDNVDVTVAGVADITAPTVAIALKDNLWDKLWNGITFGKFFNETQTFTITAEDVNTGSGLNAICYYLSDKELSEDEVKTITGWIEYNGVVKVDPDKVFVIYAKVDDNAGNVTYANSDGIVLDATLPAITGIENGGTYYGDSVFKVNDIYLDSVTVDGEAVELVADAYTIKADNKDHTIVATDKAGNSIEYKITVYKSYAANPIADSPQTGDNTVFLGWLLLLIISGVCIVVFEM